MSGEVPLTRWLHNAVLLAGGRAGVPQGAGTVFDRRRGAHDLPLSGPADAPTLDVAALPVGDTGLEIVIEEDDTLDVEFLHQGSAASRSVAKLLVHRHFNGVPSMLADSRADLGKGTGWMLAPRLLITNHHVINARIQRERRPSPRTSTSRARASRCCSTSTTPARSRPRPPRSPAWPATRPWTSPCYGSPTTPPTGRRCSSARPITKPQDRALQGGQRPPAPQRRPHAARLPEQLRGRRDRRQAQLSHRHRRRVLRVADLRRRLVRGRAPPRVADHLRRPGDGLGPADQPGELRHPGRDVLQHLADNLPNLRSESTPARPPYRPSRAATRTEVTWPTGTRAGPPAGSTG